MNTIHFFRPGRHLPMKGNQPIEFSEADLMQAAAVYDPAKHHRAPIIIGHAGLDSPAYGHVKAVQFSAIGLEAEPEGMDVEFAALVNKEAYPNVSAGWWPPDHPRNPVPGAWYLRELSFLGAVPPAVLGLRRPKFPPAFAADEDGIVRFGGDFDDQVNAGLWRRLRDWIIGKFGLDEADKVISPWDVQFLEQAAQEETEDPDESSAIPQYSQTPETDTVDAAAAARLQAENEDLKRRLAQREANDKLAAEQRRRGEAVEFADALTSPGADGVVRFAPKHKKLLVDLLMLAGQPDGNGGLAQFSADDGSSRPLLDATKAMLMESQLLITTEFADADKAAPPKSSNPLLADAERRAEEARRN